MGSAAQNFLKSPCSLKPLLFFKNNFMAYTTLLTSLEQGIFTITINRPDKLNALNSTVIEELAAVVEEIYTNEAIKAVIITGTGNKAFVAGADIAEFIK